MGLFGGDTSVLTSTTSNAIDKRTLAEQGGIAAQSIGGDLIVQDIGDEAFELGATAIQGISDLAGFAIGSVQNTALDSLDVIAASKGTQPINPVFVILAIGAAFFLMRGNKLI